MITGPITTDMGKVRQRKRNMVEREIDLHLQNYKATGAELIMGAGRLVKPGGVVVALLLKETLYAGYHKHQKRSRDSNAIER
jgi:pyruvate/2-oxoglutarate dehydrogenase complex dihydrolipoamide dehydrogenase (E3) component